MFEASELIDLILGLVGIIIITFVFGGLRSRIANGLYYGFIFIVCGYFFTVIEGVIWKNLFNVVEHVCYAMAGLCYLGGSLRLFRDSGGGGEG